MAASWIPPRGATEHRGGPSGELSRVASVSAGGPRTCGPGGAGQVWCRRRSRPRPRPRRRPALATRSAEEGSEDHPQFLRCGHDQVRDRKPPDCERHALIGTRPAVPGSTRRRALGRGHARARPATAGGVGVGLTPTSAGLALRPVDLHHLDLCPDVGRARPHRRRSPRRPPGRADRTSAAGRGVPDRPWRWPRSRIVPEALTGPGGRRLGVRIADDRSTSVLRGAGVLSSDGERTTGRDGGGDSQGLDPAPLRSRPSDRLTASGSPGGPRPGWREAP